MANAGVLTFIGVTLLSALLSSVSSRAVDDTKQEINPIGGFLFYKVLNGRVEYLLLKKAKEDDWSPPKGNLDGDESVFETAVRETREETGWLMSDDYVVQMQYKIYFEYETKDGVLKQVHLWPGQLTNFEKPIKLSPEHSEYKWLPYDDALLIIKKQYRVALTEGDPIIRAHHGFE